MAKERAITIQSSLGDALLFESMESSEWLSKPFELTVHALSKDPAVDLGSLLGENITVSAALPGDTAREFSGVVVSASLAGSVNRFARYQLQLRPWFWLLGRRHNCRIHQNKTTLEIAKEIFDEHGFSDVEVATSGEHPPREFSVQYRESDLNYVSRLLEEEGIYYYFKHQGGRHVLVLVDDISAHTETPGYEQVPFFPPEQRRERDHLQHWRAAREVCSASYSSTDYHFERPRAPLLVRRQTSPSYQPFEVFDYPGDYREFDRGESLARVRLDELRTEQEVVEGSGPVMGLSVGSLFSLTGFPRDDQNRKYLITHCHHTLREQAYESGPGAGAEYFCVVRAMDAKIPFRPARRTRRPVVEGPQTAVVVGPAGEEIFTDQYGRAKVQFHWDREGGKDESSSCWVRVAQIWAGAGFGAQFLPRIGQEVIVEFLEGDPDRPLITGRLYNGDNVLPYELPGNQTQSGVKTRSSPGGTGSNANEIRLEDKKGAEQFYVQAEKDMETLVKDSESRTVGSSRTTSIGTDEEITVGATRTETVTGDETITINSNRTETVASNETVTIGGNQTLTIGGTHSETVTGEVTQTYGAAKTETIAANAKETVVSRKNTTVGADYSINAGAAVSLNAGAGVSTRAGVSASILAGAKITFKALDEVSSSGSQQSIKSQNKMNLQCGSDFALVTKSKGVLDFGDELTIKVGSATITMKKSGDIVVKGAKITVKGSGPVALKGSKISQN